MPQTLATLAADARRAMLAVVQIHAYGFNQASVASILDPRFPEPANWRGSGFLIDVDGREGYVLTNAHVVRNATRMQMMSMMTSEEMFTLEPVGIVPSLEPDVALVRLNEESLERFRERCKGDMPTLPLGDARFIERGTNVKAIGYPYGMAEPNISGGEISNFIASDPDSSERLVTDAAINPGNSGGPAVGEGGVALGINTSIIADADNIGFITPIDWAKLLIPQMLQSDEADLADLGACLQPNSPANAAYLGQGEPTGVIVMRVFEGGMLHTAGLQRLDVITAIEDMEIDAYGNLALPEGHRRRTIYDAVRRVPVGEQVRLRFVRNGTAMEAEVEAAVRPRIDVPSQPTVSKRVYLEFQGLIIQELTLEIANALSAQIGADYLSSLEGRPYPEPRLVVSFVMPGSPADDIFFMPGSLLRTANGKEVGTLEALVEVMTNNSDAVVLETQLGGIGVFHISEDERSAIEIAHPPAAV